MNIPFTSDGKPGTLLVRLRTEREVPIRIILRDQHSKYTRYIDKTDVIKGNGKFFLRLPLMPKNGELIIFNQRNKNITSDPTFEIDQLKLLDLKRKLNRIDGSDPVVKNFVKFAQEFSKNAALISAGQSVYQSDDGEFIIEYFDDIIDNVTGNKLNTPARISQNEGRIQIAKSKFLGYTIPMRMIILLHEFSHFYMNKNMSDETEADLNALLIYLGLGYPRFEAFEAFRKVFYNSPTEGNLERWKYIEHYIENFENYPIKIDYSKNNIIN